MNDTRQLAIIMDISKLDIQTLIDMNVGIESQSFPQHILDDGYEHIIQIYKEKLANFNNIISLHGSSFDLNPGSTDNKILEVTKYRYLESINIAKEIGAKYVIFHSQLNPLISVKRIRKLKLDNQIKFWKDLLEEIKDIGIIILIENEYDDNYEELLYILKEVNSDKLKMCLDTGHVLAYSKVTLREWILGMKDYIDYVHLHFNDTTCDSHDAPNEDELELFKNLLDEANINPIISLEYQITNLEKEIKRVGSVLK